MATWDSLSVEDKDIVLTNDRLLRGAIGSYARALRELNTVKTHYDSLASAIVATLDPGETIPHNSGLAGVQSSTESFFATIHTSVATTLTNDYSTSDQENYVKLAGPSNV